jgi:neutral ceramidase
MFFSKFHAAILAFILLAAAALDAPAELLAGTAKGVISPAPDSGRIGVMGKALNGKTSEIHARVLTLYDGGTRLAIVTYDLNCLDVATPILRQRLRDELGIAPACFIPMATHNHCAPIQIVPDNFDYGRELAGKIFGLVENAIASERGPARVLTGSGYGWFLKALGNAPLDAEVQVMQVTRAGAPLAVFFNHPAHPLQIDYQKCGAGHPGYAMDAVEAALPGALALYACASGGNQFTLNGMQADPATVREYGRKLAEVVIEICGGEMRDVTGPLSAKLEVIPLPLADPMPREEAEKLASHFPRDIGCVPYPHPDRETNWIRNLLRWYEEAIPFPEHTDDMVCTDDGFLLEKLPEAREFPCRYEETIVARIGDLVFVAMQGEVCAPIGMRIKDTFRHEHPILVSAYMGEHNLYIPTREIVRLNLYQAQVIQIQYASPVRWDPAVENEMVRGVIRLVREVLKR